MSFVSTRLKFLIFFSFLSNIQLYSLFYNVNWHFRTIFKMVSMKNGLVKKKKKKKKKSIFFIKTY